MPESEEYIRGMRAACNSIEASMSARACPYDLNMAYLEFSIRNVRSRCVALEQENAQRRMKRIGCPDGGGR